MQSMTINSAAIRLTETILGDDGPDLEQTLKAIARRAFMRPSIAASNSRRMAS